MVRYHVILYGRVQGVGCRWFCTMLAQDYGVTGWVQNLPDGTVELEVQGEYHKVDSYILKVREGNRYMNVDFIEAKEIPVKKEESFRMRN